MIDTSPVGKDEATKVVGEGSLVPNNSKLVVVARLQKLWVKIAS